MGSFLDRFRKRPDPTDEETAVAMGRLAAAFIIGSAAEGESFGWESTEASRLDGICEAFLASDPPAEYRHSFIMSMGAYLGEFCTQRRWTLGIRSPGILVRLDP